MSETKIIFESVENIYGVSEDISSMVIDMVQYTGVLTIKSSGKKPVTLCLKAERPYPFYSKIPHDHTIQERTITAVYTELIRFFEKYKLEFRG
jgi:hypothetical protein